MSKRKPKTSVIPTFKPLATQLVKDALDIAEGAIKKFADHEALGFKRRILSQRFESFQDTPLAPSTLFRKAMLRLDMRTMIATSHYVDSIRVFRTRVTGGYDFYIGFGPSDLAHDSDGLPTTTSLDEVAKIQEYGSHAAHIPARPHWRPYLQEMVQRATVVREKIILDTAKLTKQRRK